MMKVCYVLRRKDNEDKFPIRYVVPWANKRNIPDGWQAADGSNNTVDFSKKSTSLPGGVWIQKMKETTKDLIKLMFLVLVGFSLVQCAPTGRIENDGELTLLHRAIDYEAGVVCWWVRREGIDCLPIEDTLLKGK